MQFIRILFRSVSVICKHLSEDNKRSYFRSNRQTILALAYTVQLVYLLSTLLVIIVQVSGLIVLLIVIF
jgi:hypothetical protein